MNHHRWLVPEVVQSSAMDCGPATLKSILDGFGIHVSYGRLREACQTDLDGTSIDVLEETANRLGLDAQQTIVPVDHVVLQEAAILPALVTLWLPGKSAHFVAAWRRHGNWVQVMDPSTGRRWPSITTFLNQLYAHEMAVSSREWMNWARSDDFIRPLRRRLLDLKLPASEADRWIRLALDRPGWQELAGLDAALRMMSGLVLTGALRNLRHHRTYRAFRSLIEEGWERPQVLRDAVPDNYWSAWAIDEEQVQLRGAVVVAVRARPRHVAVTTPQEDIESLPPELRAALREPPQKLGGEIYQALRSSGLGALVFLATGAALATITVVLEAILFRVFIDINRDIVLTAHRWFAIAAFTCVLGVLAALNVASGSGVWRAARHLEGRLRMNFLHKIPLLGDRYFRSRLRSDMAERSHNVHVTRLLPALAERSVRIVGEMVLTIAGITWLDSASGGIAAITGIATIGAALLISAPLAERDLRLRAHTGAMTRFVLDALLGLVPIRAHSGARAVRREHEALLTEWGRASLLLHRSERTLVGFQLTLGFLGAGWLLWNHVGDTGPDVTTLLLAYWALRIPLLGLEISAIGRQYPAVRNIMLRLMEPLDAPIGTENFDRTAAVHDSSGPIEVTFDRVTVRAAGHTILDDVTLAVPRGSEIAIVGPSGAGKSTLVGLLLGWSRPSTGRVLLDGNPLDAERLEQLRLETAWVDPEVQLWNRPLVDNLLYGVPPESATRISSAIDIAALQDMIEQLPDGLATHLGDGGGLLSGGEGQRVRLGRSALRTGTRLVILDEAFRGLDRPTRRSLLDGVRRLWKGATLLCITHDVDDTRDFSRVIVVEDGRIAEDGSPVLLEQQPDSRYRHQLDAAQTLRDEMWSTRYWRRMSLVDGRMVGDEGV